ncbi:hypothetical protein HUO14_04710 [Parasphingorhabdus flavimaris]|uniref:Lipoprotein n=1 Tax=Parasphingorhabdus flavimaris TaxID=266812 RepID=A0ABX2N0H6_9SPHN|nr:hypothetical protein [Parasphingorhabdus flavimaris]NVD27210.1 hypothetical protein [Parasphingorhabdus flavimaris]
MIRLVLILVLALSVGACVPTETDVNDPSETQKNPLAGMVPTAFIQTFAEPDYPTPDTFTTGSFEIKDACLVFAVSGEFLRVVMQQGSKFEPPNTVVFHSGARVTLGKTVTVKGAEGSYGLPADLPANCPKKSLLIGDLQ